TKWMKKVGDRVQRDEPLFEISTDKVDAEIPAPASGVLNEIRVEPGATVPINTVVGVIGEGDAATVVPTAAPAASTNAPAAVPPGSAAPPPKSPQPNSPPVAARHADGRRRQLRSGRDVRARALSAGSVRTGAGTRSCLRAGSSSDGSNARSLDSGLDRRLHGAGRDARGGILRVEPREHAARAGERHAGPGADAGRRTPAGGDGSAGREVARRHDARRAAPDAVLAGRAQDRGRAQRRH